jgi:hypothetical protein
MNGTHLALSTHRIDPCTANGTVTNTGMLDMGLRFELANQYNPTIDGQFYMSITVPESTMCLTSGSMLQYIFDTDAFFV